MSRREAWDWATEQTYIPRGRVGHRPAMIDHAHTCPDGTPVVVSAQFIEMTNMTLYRWTVGGQAADPTSRPGDQRDVAPDWTTVDRAHSVAA